MKSLELVELIKKSNDYNNLCEIVKTHGNSELRYAQEVFLKLCFLTKNVENAENYNLLFYKRSGYASEFKYWDFSKFKIIEFLESNINNGCESGKADLIIVDNEKNFVCISSKCPDFGKIKNFDYYETSKFYSIYEQMLKNGFKNNNEYCGIVTNCSIKDLEKFKDSKNSLQVNLNWKFIFGIEDLQKMFIKIKKYLVSIDKTGLVESIWSLNKICKKRMSLKFYQEYIYKNLLEKCISDDTVLLACAPRIGKSFICAEYILNSNHKNILICCRLKTNVKEGQEKLFLEMSNFEENGFKIHFYKTNQDDVGEKNIYINTCQTILEDETEKFIKKFDLVIYDESHIGSKAVDKDCEYIAPDRIDKVCSKNAKKIIVSATFKSAMNAFNISEKNTVHFSDMEICLLRKKDPDFIKNMENVLCRKITDKEYKSDFHYPIIDVFNMNIVVKDIENTRKECSSGDYSISNLYDISSSGNNFRYESDVLKLLKNTFKRNDNLKSNNCMIDNIQSKYDRGSFKIVLVFLSSIKAVDLVENILKNNFSKNYNVISFHSGKKNCKNPLEQIKNIIDNGSEKTLLVLACSMLETAITIDLCDGIIMMDDISSEDRIYQRICRPCSNKNDRVFVLDINPNRVLNSIVKYAPYNGNIEIFSIKNYFRKLIGGHYNIWDENFNLANESVLENIHKEYYIQNGFLDGSYKNENIYEKCFSSIENTDSIKDFSFDCDINISNKVMKTEINKKLQYMEKVKKFSLIENGDKILDDEPIDEENIKNDICKLIIFKTIMKFVFGIIIVLSTGETLEEKIINLKEDDLEKINQKTKSDYNFSINREIILNVYKKLSRKDPIFILSSNIIMSIEFINMFLKPNNIQKKKNGEVFTPLELIREKCSKVPEEFWRDKNVKVLDPCCGIGNYQVVLIEFFMKGLVDEIKDERERLEWIKTRIIYCSDICALNVALCKKITGVENVYCMDFLEKNMFDEMKFDMVIGNPPYQKNFNNKISRVGGSNLWSEFINKSMNILKENGYLIFITPCSWMTGSSSKQSGNILKGVMQKNTLLYLNIEECSKYFKVCSTFSFYIIQKTFKNIKFKCVCRYKKNIYESYIENDVFRYLKVIPKLLNNEMISLIYKVENTHNDKFNFKRIYDLSSVQTKRYSENGKNYTRHKVVDIKHTDTIQECMNKEKIIISMPGYLKAMYEKECGVTEATFFMYVKNKEEGDLLIKILNSDIYKLIINSYRELTGLNNHKNINRLSIVKDLNMFNLTDEEIKLIEENT